MNKPTPAFVHVAYWLVMISLLVVAIGRDLSQPAAPPSHNKETAQSKHEAETRDPKGEGGKSFWERTTDDPVAFFTLWLAIFTFVLAASTIGLWIVTWRASRSQSDDMTVMLATASAHAKAAASQAEAMGQLHAAAVAQESAIREQALATKGLLEHTPQIERAYLSCTFVRVMMEVKQYVRETLALGTPASRPVMIPSGNMELRVSNHGKTPAEVTGYVVHYCTVNSIPDIPEYGEIAMYCQWLYYL